jgi:putative ATP-binding cassette transporter
MSGAPAPSEETCMSLSVTARAATFAQVVKRVFALAAPYFRSEEKWRARAMLLGIVALNLFYVYVAVLGNQWYGRFYDGLQNKDSAVFWREVGVFGWIAFFNIAVQVLKFYVTQLLQLRWRSWMTRDYLSRWMSDRTFYHLELARYANQDGQAPDNPDQRIQEDMQMFTDYTMTLSMGLLNAVVTLVSFVGILWGLSGSFAFSMGGSTYQIAGRWSGWRWPTAWWARPSRTSSAAR